MFALPGQPGAVRHPCPEGETDAAPRSASFPSSFPRKRESREDGFEVTFLDSRLRGNDEVDIGIVINDPFFIEVPGQGEKQRGFSLFVVMIFLLALSLLVVTVMRNVVTHERMAGNTQDWNLAFQAAEAALRDGQIDVFQNVTGPEIFSVYAAAGCNTNGRAGLCLPATNGTPIWTRMLTDDPCWAGTDTEPDDPTATNNCTVSQRYSSQTKAQALANPNPGASPLPQPRYVIEYLGPAGTDSLVEGKGQPSTPKYAYRVTAAGFGNIRTDAGAPATRVVLQSVVQK